MKNEGATFHFSSQSWPQTLLKGSLVLLMGCDANLKVQVSEISNPDTSFLEVGDPRKEGKAKKFDDQETCIDPDLKQIPSDTTLSLCNGTLARGEWDLENLKPENIVIGATIGGVSGMLSAAPPPCASDGATGCLTSNAFPAASVSAAVPGNIKTGERIAGVDGAYADPTTPCMGNNEIGCVATATYRAADFSSILSSHIKNGVTVAGVVGTYPSLVSPLGTATGVNDLMSLAASTPAGLYEFFDSSGVRHSATIMDAGAVAPSASTQVFNAGAYRQFTVAGDAALMATNVKNGVNVFGVSGTVVPTPGTCAANHEVDCIATTTFQAADFSALTAANIKAGVVVADVTGAYPSPSHPLSGATPMPDMPAFGAVAGGTSYEWFRPDGTRVNDTIQNDVTVTPGGAMQTLNAGLYRSVTVGGDGNLVPGNLQNGTTIFGITGNVVPASMVLSCASDGATSCETNVTFVAVDTTDAIPSNIKAGVQIAGVLGSLSGVPADCGSNGEIGCVATTSYKAANLTGLLSANVKNGVTIAGTAGTYPSLATPLAGASGGVSDLMSLSASTAADAYEFFDAAGNRYTGNISDAGTVTPSNSSQSFSASLYRGFVVAGDADLVASNIRSGVTIFGVNGSMATTPAHCASDGAENCLATALFPAANTTAFSGGDLRAGKTVAAIVGTLADCAADGGSACVVDGLNYKAARLANFTSSDVRSSVSVAGVAGSGSLESHGSCTSEGVTGCVTTASYISANVANITAENIKAGVTIAGVTGQYPSAAYPLPGASGVVADLLSGTFDAQMTNATAFEYWNAAGARQTGFGDEDIVPAKIASGATIFTTTGSADLESHVSCASDGGINCIPDGASYKAARLANFSGADIRTGVTIASVPGGAVIESHAACASDGAGNCVVNGTTYKAASVAAATPANIKKGVTIAGVLGDYPSATNKLSNADATADLMSGTFNDQMKVATAFEWFDSKGARHTGAGDGDIKAGLIATSVDIFGTTGTYGIASLSVSSLTASPGVSKIATSWTRMGSAIILVKRAGASVTWAPTNGTSYSPGSLDVNHTIVYVGTAVAYDDTSVSSGTTYYYKAYAYNADYGYSVASDEAMVTYSNHICGGAGDGCYNDTAAMTAGSATTPSGKSIAYVTASGSFKVWKDATGNRILEPSGLDAWAKQLNTTGKGFSATDFTDYATLVGRVCPPNVYVDDTNQYVSGRCLYYTQEGNSVRLDTVGMTAWSAQAWFFKNITTCSAKGMRLPTIFETDGQTSNPYYPSGSPSFGQSNGVPPHPSATYTWTATTFNTTTTRFVAWETGGAAGSVYNSYYGGIRCVLP